MHRGARDAGRDPAELDVIVTTATLRSDDLAVAREQVRPVAALVGNHVAEVLRNSGRDSLPAELEALVAERLDYDYHQHVKHNADQARYLPDEMLDRLCRESGPSRDVRRASRRAGRARRDGRELLRADRRLRDAWSDRYASGVHPAVARRGLMPFVDELRGRTGEELHVSDWFEIRQVDVDVFAAVTRDWDHMHNDPAWAAETGPWGTTIAHGFYLLSLVSHFQSDAGFPTVATEDEYLVNYGLDKVRFIEPVQVGDRVRARLRITALEPRKPGRELVRTEIVYETQRCGERPHMIAEALTLSVYGEAFTDAR